MNHEGIKDCPFCGMTPHIVTDGAVTKSGEAIDGFFIDCRCDITMGLLDEDQSGKRYGQYDTKKDAITAWNQRSG